MIKQIKQNWLIILILLVAAFCRLYRISDYMEFLGDQGRDVVVAASFLQQGHIFTIGPQTSIGNMYLGPYYYYLFVVPGLLLADFSPVGPAVIVAILGVLTVYLLFRFTKKWFNPTAAYFAAFLFAISPVVIKYSDFSWNPNIMPLFALLFIYFCLESNFIWASLAFIVCLNSHFLSLLLLPLGFLIFLYHYFKTPQKRSIFIKNLLIAIVIFVISLTPQVLFDIKHHGQNINAIITFFTDRQTTVNLKPYKALPQIAPLFNQLTTRLVAGENVQFGLIVSIVLVLLFIFEFYRQYKAKKLNLNFLWITLWLLIGLTGLALYKQHIYDHYFGFLYPAIFIFLSYLLSRLPRILFSLFLIPLVIFSLLQNPFRWTPPRQLATTTAIDDSIITASGHQPFNFALLSKMNYDPPYRYIFSQKKAPVVLLHDQVADQLFVVCEPFQIDCNPINNPEWDVAAFGWAKISSQWQINGITIFRLVHNPSGQK
jgi:4-amino-4-deoxy-L-arabinose transferase-like glycosyltransferase